MEDLTFGEQVKIILGRKGMTIKELAEIIEGRTGKKMSRQNLTQRLGRDNFQEQDMRMIANILGCSFHLSILMEGQTASPVQTDISLEKRQIKEEHKGRQTINEETEAPQYGRDRQDETEAHSKPVQGTGVRETDITIGELYKIHEELSELEENAQMGEPAETIKEELEKQAEENEEKLHTEGIFLRTNKSPGEEEGTAASVRRPGSITSRGVSGETDDFEPVIKHEDAEEDLEIGEMNPYTGREYQSNSVRMHPSRIGYVQVYNRDGHKWTDMTEWAFLGYQERKKALLGKDYEPPIYLD